MDELTSKIVYIINTSDEPNNVIFSHASFIKDMGYNPCFVFPFRHNAKNNENFYREYEVLRLNFIFRTDSALLYLISIIKFLFYVSCTVKKNSEAKNILAIDLLGVIACIFLKIRGFHINTLVNDNFSARYKLPKFLYIIFVKAEQWLLKLISFSCIFPNESRFILLGSPKLNRVDYIPNILTDEYTPAYRGAESGKLIVMFCGWLHPTRGIELFDVLYGETNENVEFIFVGFGDQNFLDSIKMRERVKWLGSVSREDNLDLMCKSDVNVAFYNPNILINRCALPQKVFDSLLVGCPVIINSEVELSERLYESGVCFRSRYFDILNLATLLNALSEDKSSLRTMSQKMRDYYSRNYSFDEVRNKANIVYKEIIK